MSSMDLETAYKIAGGYIEADEKTFEKALKMVKEHDHDAKLAEMLKEAHNEELLAKHKQEKSEEFAMRVDGKILEENTSFLYSELDNTEIDEELLKDDEIIEAVKNTPFVDINDEGEEFILSEEDKAKHVQMLIEKAKIDTFIEQSTSREFGSLSDEEKKKTLFEEIKTSFLGTLVHLRTAQQIQNNIPEAGKAVAENNEDFFIKQQEALGTMAPQEKAADFNEVISVSSDLVISACADSEHRLKSFAKKLSDRAETLKGKAKEAFQNASNLAHKLRVSFNDKAKSVWGQRYEFANSLRDRAPKVVTDVAATIGLVGATVTNAPWLGTAVVAYGAYKAASSWVWPLVTKTRTSARLDRKNPDAPKKSFMERFKEVTKTVFGDPDEKKAYFKEAGWGSAAGLVGLGAAGAVASGALGALGTGASAVAARSAQRLSSLAVSSVNGAMNTVSTLKNKKKSAWDKAFAVVGFGVTAAIIANCCDGNSPDDLTGSKEAGNSGNMWKFLKNDSTANEAIDTAKVATSELTSETDSTSIATNGLTETQDTTTKVLADTTQTTDVDSLRTAQVDSLKTEQADSLGIQNTVTSAPTDVEQETVPSNAETELNATQTSEISAPTEWSEETGITKAQWNRLQTFWGGAEKYQEFYGRISDEMLQKGGQFEGMTRDEVLFKYERLTSWNLPQHRDAIAKLDSFFGGCNDYIANEDAARLGDVMDNGGIKDVEGTECVRVTGRDVNCSEKSILHSEKYDCGCDNVEEIVETVEETPVQVEEELTITEGSNVVTDLTEEKETTTDVKVIRTNNLDASSAKVVEEGLEIEDVNVEAKDMNIVTNVSEGATSTAVEVTSETQEGATMSAVEVTSETSEVIETLVETTASEATSEASEVVETMEETTAREATSETSEVVETVEEVTNAEIIEGSENVEEGTPAAGNVEERGGYNNSGITEKQYNRMQTFFKNRFGENAYDDYAEKITDEMRAKGGIFEGLSVEQSMFSIQQIIAWSNDKVGEFSKEINTIVDYLKGCSNSISLEDAPDVKEVVDRVNENGTIDGVTGTKNVMVRYFTAGGCGEAGSYATEQTANGVTNPSTEGFDRLYMRPQVAAMSEEPIEPLTIVEGKDVVLDLTEEKDATEVKVIRTNNLDTSSTKVIKEGLNLNDVNVKPKDMPIMTNVGKGGR